MLLESRTSHPDVWNANAITGRKHQINVVFNSIYGGKFCSIGAIEDSILRNKDDTVDVDGNYISSKHTRINVDVGNGKLVKRTKPKYATDKVKEKRKSDSQEYKMNIIVESASKEGIDLFNAGESVCFVGSRSQYLLPIGTDYNKAIDVDVDVKSGNQR